MGKYINEIDGSHIGTTFNEKCKGLEKAGARQIAPTPTEYESDLVCVVDNGFFGAAAYAYSKEEFDEFKRPDGRPKKWYKFPNAGIYAD